MKMISNDLRSSCRALLLQSYGGGGDGGKYDSVYHDILENIVPIIEHYNLGGGFTWTIGLWMSDIGIGGRYETNQNGVMSCINGVNTAEKSAMQLNTFRRGYYHAGIIYKDNEPMYATIIQQISDISDQWGTWNITINDNEDYRYRTSCGVIYKQQGDYSIDSITDVSYTKFEPRLYYYPAYNTDGTREDFIAGFDMYFTTDLAYKSTISYQRYTASAADDFTEPVVKKYGERTSQTGRNTLSYTSLYPFPRLYGGYSDLDNSTWFNVMQELSYAILEKAGAKTEPLKIIQPAD